MTWNIHGGRDASFDVIAAEIGALRPDVVCLNEVPRGRGKRIARSLGMRAFEAASRIGPYGNVIVTGDVVSARRLRFEGVRRVDRRDAMIVDLVSGVTVAAFHLNLRAERRIADMRQLLGVLPDRTVLAGDANEGPHGPVWREASRRYVDPGEALAAFTFPAAQPRERLDFIWVPVSSQVTDYRVVATGSSDHRPVIVDIQI